MATLKKGINPKPGNEPHGRVPPQAPDMEEAVLGAIMLERDTFERVMEIIPSHECFYIPAHRHIYKAICNLYNAGHPTDLLTITEELRKTSELEATGGAYYLTRLTMAVLSSANVETYARVVMEKFMKREVIRIAGQMIGGAFDDGTDVFDLMEQASNDIKAVADGILKDDAVMVGRTYQTMLEHIQRQQQLKSDLIGITSGFPDLDRLTLGWTNTDLIVLAARPSQGKTAMAVNFARNAAEKGAHVLLFSLESSDLSLVRRMAAAKNSIPLEDIRTGRLTPKQEATLHGAASEFYKLPIKTDSKSRKIATIKKAARRWKKRLPQGSSGLVIIDYLQLMSTDTKANREQEVSSMSRDLKELAVELEVPVIALSQLNREVEKRASKKPTLADIRESGAIEQDANIIMFIWWEELPGNGRQLHILVEKNRDGKCGDVLLKMNGDFQKILSIDDMDQDVYPSFIGYRHGRPSGDEWDEAF